MSLVAGMCTAGGAYTPTMADEHIMVHKIANVYLGGPPLVKAALGETISGEEVCLLPLLFYLLLQKYFYYTFSWRAKL